MASELPDYGVDLQLRIGYFIVVWVGIAIFFANLEKFVFERKTKYLLTLAAVVEGTMSIVLYQVQGGTPEFFIILWTSAIGFFIPALALIVLFAKIAKNSVGSVRTAVVLALTGFLLFIVGMLADLPEAWYIGSSFLPGSLTGIAAPIILFAGLAILIIAFEKMFTEDIKKA